MVFVFLMSSILLGQSSTPSINSTTDPSARIADQIKALQDAMAQQQKQIETLQRELAEQRNADAKVVNATYSTNPAATTAVSGDIQGKEVKESPLSFGIGAAEFTPGGFVDFENVFRSTNTGNAAATSFGAIPFSNAPTGAGHLTEFRTTGQYSRLNLKVTTKFGDNDVTGYIEGDFNGNDAPNVFVGTNPHTARIRLYWLDLKRGRWEFLGGQSWGLMTPNRTGLSPMPSDLALGLGEDANVHVGINHTRAGTLRVVFHPNDNFAWAFGIENPDQFTNGEVTFPAVFALPMAAQFDAADKTTAPNMAPDFNTKLAWDSDPMGRHFHFELGGMMTTVKIASTPTGVAGATPGTHSKVGGGFETALNFELVKNFRFIGNGMWGNGIGRYLIGLAPNAVIVPVNAAGLTCTAGVGCDVRPSLVHSGNATFGFELQPAAKTQFGVYYGGLYAQRNFFPDITSAALFKPLIGFGAPGAGIAAAQNRAIQQGTIDWTQTLWRNPQYGAILLVTQYSYLTRAPWFVATGGPKNAHLSMGYLSVRYVLP
jgi:hypothetical protein